MPTRLALSVLLFSSLAYADPPGKIVIRPGGTPGATPAAPTAPTAPTPDRPGTIVIRPQPPGSRILETGAVPPTTPAAPPTNPVPIPDPKPVLDPKPAAPPKTAEANDADKGKLLSETWDVAFVKGMKVGYFHVLVKEYQRDGKTLIHGVKKQEITIGRFGQKVTTSAEDSTLETPDGAVLIVRMAQEVSSGQKLVVTGKVDGQLLHVSVEGMMNGKDDKPWPEGVLGISKELSLYKDKKPKRGDAFDYNVFVGQAGQAMKISVKCLALETVRLVENEKPKPYLKFETKMEPIGDFQIPPATVWVDAETFEVIRTDQDLPSLGGRLTLLRTTKEVALRPVGDVPDLFDVQSIHLDKAIQNVHDKAAITYKIDLSTDPKPFTCFAKDDRQTPTLTGEHRKTVELKVLHHRLVPPALPSKENIEAGKSGFVNWAKDISKKQIDEIVAALPPTATAADKMRAVEAWVRDNVFLGTSFFIDWDNALTKKQAAAIAASLPMNATDADKARAVETWVHKNMKAVEFTQAMAPTSETSKTLSGDCTEYSMLAAGLCRALKLPSRTALGLVYATGPGGKPMLAYHMWFEVWHDGRWVPYDATLGRGGIGAGHLKITDAHWYKENSFAPLLPVLRVLMAQPKVTVGEIEEKR